MIFFYFFNQEEFIQLNEKKIKVQHDLNHQKQKMENFQKNEINKKILEEVKKYFIQNIKIFLVKKRSKYYSKKYCSRFICYKYIHICKIIDENFLVSLEQKIIFLNQKIEIQNIKKKNEEKEIKKLKELNNENLLIEYNNFIENEKKKIKILHDGEHIYEN